MEQLKGAEHAEGAQGVLQAAKSPSLMRGGCHMTPAVLPAPRSHSDISYSSLAQLGGGEGSFPGLETLLPAKMAAAGEGMAKLCSPPEPAEQTTLLSLPHDCLAAVLKHLGQKQRCVAPPCTPQLS